MGKDVKEPKSAKNWASAIKTGASLLSDVLLGGVFTKVEKETDVLLHKAEARALILEEKIARRWQCAAIISLAWLFLLFAFFFYLMDTLALPRTAALLIVAALLLITGLYLKYKYLKEELA